MSDRKTYLVKAFLQDVEHSGEEIESVETNDFMQTIDDLMLKHKDQPKCIYIAYQVCDWNVVYRIRKNKYSE